MQSIYIYEFLWILTINIDFFPKPNYLVIFNKDGMCLLGRTGVLNKVYISYDQKYLRHFAWIRLRKIWGRQLRCPKTLRTFEPSNAQTTPGNNLHKHCPCMILLLERKLVAGIFYLSCLTTQRSRGYVFAEFLNRVCRHLVGLLARDVEPMQDL
jgi:hypothetical protein